MASKFSLESILTMTDGITRPLRAMTGSVNSASKKMTNDFTRVAKAQERMRGIVGQLAPYFTAGAIVGFANKSIEAFQESQAAIANVEAGLKSTNNAIGLTSKQIAGMAEAWQKITIFEDDSILQNVSAQLLTFDKIGRAVFDRVQKASLDVTAKIKGINATGEDLRGTSIMMGKMFNDLPRGMNAARRVGISFTAQEESMIKTLWAAGRQVEAQTMALKIIEKQYGGTAEALAKTDKGMEILAKNQMGNTIENIGEQLAPIKAQLYGILGAVLPFVNKYLPQIITLLTIVAGCFVITKIATYAQVAAFAALKGVYFAGEVIKWIKYLMMMWPVIAKAVTMTKAWAVAQKVLNFILSANPIGLIIMAVAALGYAIYQLYQNWDKVTANFKYKLNEWLYGFNAIKLQVYELLHAIGLVSKKQLLGAQISELQSKINFAESIQERKAAGYASPKTETAQSQTSKTQVDVNFNNTPKGTTVRSSGKTAPGTTLNLGLNPQ